ncbi:MAG: HAMP domain-containing histidine kinase [Firmicutes bacterium]|nr:HAMP domain-containing histidine kinase [Bacillota bacterium]
MKTDTDQKKNSFAGIKSLRFRLTTTFVGFALVLMGMLWIMQVGFLEEYYEMSMEKRAELGLKMIGAAYSTPPELDMDSFCTVLGNLSVESDMYISIKDTEGRFSISSNDSLEIGRTYKASTVLVMDAITRLTEAGQQSMSYTIHTGSTNADILVNASIVTSPYRSSIYLVTMTPLTPLGPAVTILSGQLKLITLISMVLGAFFAFLYSKRMAKPVIELSESARQLAKGNYDADFSVTGYLEVAELSAALRYAADELSKSDNLRKDLLANVSHDLRTPLTMIKSYAELIRDISGENKERRDEHLQVIIEETDRLSDLVGDILALSKLQAGTEEMEFKPFDLQEAARSIVNVYKVLEEQDGFTVSLSTLPETVIVSGDERKLQQVMSNLLSNAIRYSGESKSVEISLSEADGRICFAVTDHGIGIDEADQEMIWNRYQKASRQGTRARGTGTGLGLSIAKEILERHGARYGVESKVGEGSCFWFSLPIAEKTIDADMVV